MDVKDVKEVIDENYLILFSVMDVEGVKEVMDDNIGNAYSS